MTEKRTRLETLKETVFMSEFGGGWGHPTHSVVRFRIPDNTRFDLVQDGRLYIDFDGKSHEVDASEIVDKLLSEEIARVVHSIKDAGYGYGH